eukprot:912040_1
MDRYLVKDNTIQSSKKRKRSTTFEECKENESEKLGVSIKKRRRNNVNYKESSDEEYRMSDAESSQEEDSDVENTNNSNTNNINNNTDSSKDKQITILKKRLQQITEKYSKMKIENVKLKKKIKSTPAKSGKNSNSKEKSEKEIAKMKKKYLKKWAKRLPKVAGMKKTKFLGCSKEIVVEEVGFDRVDFDAIFGDKGRLIQPRPDYKPTSTVIIRQFSSWNEIDEIFKDYGLTEKVTVQIWRNRNFSKSRYCGESEASISSLNVCYNKSRKILQLKFECDRNAYGGWFW